MSPETQSVYIVTANYPEDGFEILGVVDSKEEARIAADSKYKGYYKAPVAKYGKQMQRPQRLYE